MKVTKFLSGTLIGGLLGAAVAILIAPASGDELRALMKARVEQVQEDVEYAAAERRAELEEELAALRAGRKPPEGY
jgi:gas vesicle protein